MPTAQIPAAQMGNVFLEVQSLSTAATTVKEPHRHSATNAQNVDPPALVQQKPSQAPDLQTDTTVQKAPCYSDLASEPEEDPIWVLRFQESATTSTGPSATHGT